MTTADSAVPSQRRPELAGQTVVVIGGSAGIGLETARRARAEGADVILTGRHLDRLQQAALDVDAYSTAAFDAHDPGAMASFCQSLPTPIDHVLVTAGGPTTGRSSRWSPRRSATPSPGRPLLAIQVARNVADKLRPGGSLLLVGDTGGRRISVGLGIASAVTAAMPPLTASLALELAPIRVNLIAPGFVDTSLSASILGDGLQARREQLRTTLPIRRVIGPADVAALAIHLMTNTALTGATYDIDGGQQFVE